MNVLILGATSGIAKSTAYKFASENVNLILAGRDIAALELIAKDLSLRYSIKCDYLYFDALDYNSHSQFFAKSVDMAGTIDGVLIAFGLLANQEEAQNDFSVAEKVIHTNFTSCVSILNIVSNYMESRKNGFICVLSSVAGDRGRQSNYFYGAAKGALSIFLQGLRSRLSKKGVFVLTVKPGFVDTKMTYGQSGMFLVAKPEKVANDIFRAIKSGKNSIYTPFFWKYIMLIIKSIPENIFKKLKL